MKTKVKYLRNTPAEEAAINAGIASDPDTYELTDEEFAQLRPASKKRRGRPPLVHTKEPVNLRLDHEVLAYFRASGAGWQTRLNATLASCVARRLKRRTPQG